VPHAGIADKKISKMRRKFRINTHMRGSSSALHCKQLLPWFVSYPQLLYLRAQQPGMHTTYISLLVLAAFVAASTFASPGRLCGPPEVPAYGSAEGGARSSYDLGEYVQYSCDEGYSIQGPNVAVCIYGEGGPSWNNPPPHCRRKF